MSGDGALSAGQLFEELGAPLELSQSRVMEAAAGELFESDGSMKVAIIRPCVSRGKRINGLPPIYSPRMLAEAAAVFTNWPMYEDHMMEAALDSCREQLAEVDPELVGWVEERARRIRELGGRVVRSYWDPEVVFEDDDEYGYQRGAVVGEVIPQARIREMLETDPGILNVSINAWPSGATPGTAPWDPSVRGMMIEGIRSKPQGSVDWVFRGGAGGRPLLKESEKQIAVGLLEGAYDSARRRPTDPKEAEMNLKDATPDKLREEIKEKHPHLLPAIGESEAGGGDGTITVTPERLSEMVSEAVSEALEEKSTEADAAAAKLRKAKGVEAKVHALLTEVERNGLAAKFVAQIKEDLSIDGDHIPPDLILAEDVDSDEQITEAVRKLVDGRVRKAAELIEAAGGTPRVTGIGGEGKPEVKEGEAEGERSGAFDDFLNESGDVDPEKGVDATIDAMLSE